MFVVILFFWKIKFFFARNGVGGEPIITHGHTLTSRLLARDVIRIIAEWAFGINAIFCEFLADFVDDLIFDITYSVFTISGYFIYWKSL